MKVVAILGSPRKGHTHALVERIASLLGAEGDTHVDFVHLGELNLKPCRGCYICQSKGEEFCPLGDDLLAVVERMRAADGVILASPTYTANVSGIMKNFMDRMAWTAHRPLFIGKPAMIVSTASGSTRGALQALGWFRYPGFDIVARVGRSVWPSPRFEWSRRAADDEGLRAAVRRFHQAMRRPRRALSLRQVIEFYVMKVTAVTDPRFFRADDVYHADIESLGFAVPTWKKRIGEAVCRVGTAWVRRRVVARPPRKGARHLDVVRDDEGEGPADKP